jgi:hypothetical protein
MKPWNWAMLGCASVLLAACAQSVPLQRAQIDSLARDTKASDVDRVLAGATVVAQSEIVDNEKAFLARHYRLVTGSRQEMTMVCTPNCFPIFITVPVTADYVVIQRLPLKELHAWGTLEELSKDADPAVSSLMPAVKERFSESRKKKP